MNLKMYLVSIGMTIAEFSRAMAVSDKYLSRIIHGHVKPSFRLARQIETATDGKVKISDTIQPLRTARQAAQIED